MTLSINEIVASTLFHQREEAADGATNNNAVLKRLATKGKMEMVDGGYELREPIEYPGSNGVTWFSGYEQLPTSPESILTDFVYDWKQVAKEVVIDGMTVRKNKGSKTQLIRLLSRKVDAAKRALQNGVATSLRSDGTAAGGKEFTGLQAQVPDDPSTGTQGGIDRAEYAWAASVKYDFSADLLETRTAANYQRALLNLWLQLVRGNDQPDLGLADNDHFADFHNSLTAIQRITDESSDVAKAGFRTLKFMNVDIVLDGGYGGATGNRTYLLNTDYIRVIGHSDLWFSPLGGKREPVDQDAVVQYIGCMGNMTCSCPFLQGVLID